MGICSGSPLISCCYPRSFADEELAYPEPKPPLYQALKAAVTIQAWWRGQLVRRTVRHAVICVWCIQRWWSRTYCQLQEKRRVKALVTYVWPQKNAVLLQSVFKMWVRQTEYKKYQKAALVIQNNWRYYIYLRAACNFANSIPGREGVDLNIEIIVG